MPHTVNDIFQEQEVVCVTNEETVLRALNLMIENDYSQLPVIDKNHHPIGLVTYESILNAVRNFNLRPDDLSVRNVMIQPDLFQLEDTLSDVFERLKLANTVLIKSSEGTLVGIVTTYDATEYFRKYAEDLMVVEDVEGMMKDLIRLAYGVADDDGASEKLAEAIVKFTKYKKGKPFGKLSFGDYVDIILAEETWPQMQTVFGLQSSQAVRNLLDGVRKTRNDLAHFQGEITHTQRGQLKFCLDWLERCQSEYEQHIENERKTNVVKPEKPLPIQEEIAEESLPSDSRFTPLTAYLQSQPGRVDVVKLSFEEIEKIIGEPLPASAYAHRAWWANDSKGHPHSQSWLDAGWRTNYLNRTGKIITFVRIREREQAYIKFFSNLLDELKKVDFPIKKVSPDGASWIVIQTLPRIGGSFGSFTFSFSRDKRLRVELYLDLGDREKTKEAFDQLFGQKDQIENQAGVIEWERLDSRRASRLALYHEGQISDEKKHPELRKWAVETMVKFYHALLEPADKAILYGNRVKPLED